ncbi:MAG: NADPH-dependent F420 reductase [Acidobacteria bacterium]|nr:NADPH-dependent F420 reductase [Acidobacteriota bacterium]MYG75170.1 NADPH-dependent F420 reductase [Acidobacteriota bacterium]
MSSRLAVLGGTGAFGLGLAWRLALGGAEVVIGSRDEKRAEEAAARVRSGLDPAGTVRDPARELAVSGATNRAAAATGDAVFVSVPFAGQDALLEETGSALDGKLVISCAVIWPPGSRPETSAAEEAERVLRRAGAGKVRMAAAFQTVAAGVLRLPPGAAGNGPAPDSLVFADETADREAAARMAAFTGLRAVPVGPLRKSRAAEAALGLLLELNRHSARHAGLMVTGLTRRG